MHSLKFCLFWWVQKEKHLYITDTSKHEKTFLHFLENLWYRTAIVLKSAMWFLILCHLILQMVCKEGTQCAVTGYIWVHIWKPHLIRVWCRGVIKFTLVAISNKHRFAISHICQEWTLTAKSNARKIKGVNSRTLTDTDTEGAATITDGHKESRDFNSDMS